LQRCEEGDECSNNPCPNGSTRLSHGAES
jgi:hypothetical protein